MKLHEKIKKIRQEKNLTLKELHLKIFNEFREKAVAYRTLLRIEAGDTDGRGTTLYQISTALGMSLSELKKDTEEENRPVDFVKKTKRLGRYVFNEKAYAELMMRQNHNFMTTELVLEPGGSTKLERDPELAVDENTDTQIKESIKKANLQAPLLEDYKLFKFEKYLYCLRGTITCYIGKEKFVLKNGDGLTFPSSLPHWFENAAKSACRCLIFQNPRYL
ncbi:MAG: XRE family transcriptional regulator [Candidatus Omnitrophota bacterium]|nr:XRE family transcriptional regulator [Candidatus Omnitrophota bacterium]